MMDGPEVDTTRNNASKAKKIKRAGGLGDSQRCTGVSSYSQPDQKLQQMYSSPSHKSYPSELIPSTQLNVQSEHDTTTSTMPHNASVDISANNLASVAETRRDSNVSTSTVDSRFSQDDLGSINNYPSSQTSIHEVRSLDGDDQHSSKKLRFAENDTVIAPFPDCLLDIKGPTIIDVSLSTETEKPYIDTTLRTHRRIWNRKLQLEEKERNDQQNSIWMKYGRNSMEQKVQHERISNDLRKIAPLENPMRNAFERVNKYYLSQPNQKPIVTNSRKLSNFFSFGRTFSLSWNYGASDDKRNISQIKKRCSVDYVSKGPAFSVSSSSFPLNFFQNFRSSSQTIDDNPIQDYQQEECSQSGQGLINSDRRLSASNNSSGQIEAQSSSEITFDKENCIDPNTGHFVVPVEYTEYIIGKWWNKMDKEFLRYVPSDDERGQV